MNIQKTAKLAGALFILATLSFMTGNGLLTSLFSQPDYLALLYPAKTQVILGSLLEMVNSIAVLGIAVLLLPLLKKYNEIIAYAYLASRIIEAALLSVGAISALGLLTVSQSYIASPETHLQSIGDLAVAGHSLSFQVAMLILSLGSLLFCYLLYQHQLVPSWLAALGLIGYVFLSASVLLDLFGFGFAMYLYLPGALFEIIFPIWLIVKGFSLTPTIQASSPKPQPLIS